MAKKAATKTAATTAEPRITLVEIKRIAIDETDTDRIVQDDSAHAEMVESVKRWGVMQPIGLAALPAAERKGGALYRRVWGSRRLAAAIAAGLSEIPAVVNTYASERELLEARETENLQRVDLNPVEEAAAVARLLDLAEISDGGEDLDRDRVRSVAERLGKSETWVRDRAFLARLGGKSRKLALDGRLPLAHAREIAKLADPNLRDQFAADSVADGYREQPIPLSELRIRVAKNLFSLAQVPWDLGVAFADAPACADCPANSANAPGLFEHHTQFAKDPKSAGGYGGASGSSEPAAGVCTNPACYKRKSGNAKRSANSAAKRALKAIPEGKTISAKTVAEHVPEHVSRAAVAAIARDLSERKTETATGAKVRSHAGGARLMDGPNKRAVTRWVKANEKIRDRFLEEVRKRAEDRPESLVCALAAAQIMPAFDYLPLSPFDESAGKRTAGEIRKREKETQSTEAGAFFALVANGPIERAYEILAAEAKAAGGKNRKRRPGRQDVFSSWAIGLELPRLPAPIAAAALRAMGVEVDYRSIDSFLEAETKAGAAGESKKKTAKKKTAKKKTAKKKTAGAAG